MAEKPTKKSEEDAEPTAQPAATPKTSLFPRSVSLKWLLVVVGLSLALHAATFAYLRLLPRAEPPASPEVGLGEYHFEADRSEGGRIARADFSLHVALLEPPDTAARWRLNAHKRHIQESVEELLRKAHGGDFDDPGVHDLKRQLLEQINQAMGTRNHFRSHRYGLEVAADRRAEARGFAHGSFASLGGIARGPLRRGEAPAAAKSAGLADAEKR